MSAFRDADRRGTLAHEMWLARGSLRDLERNCLRVRHSEASTIAERAQALILEAHAAVLRDIVDGLEASLRAAPEPGAQDTL